MVTTDEPIDGSNLSISQIINKVKQADKQLRKAPPIVLPSELGTLLTDVQELKLDWLWEKRILRGKVTLLDGDPDLGKSLITLDLAARVTTGQPMPDGSRGIKGNVILIAPEDDPSDTIKPRILAAGGDPSRVRLLTMLDSLDPRTEEPRLTSFTLPTHLTTLISSVQHSRAVLVIIDPFVAVLNRTVSVTNDQQMRNILTWLGHLAHHSNCAILLVRHLNKGSSGNALYRGSGSIGIIASARSSLLVVRDPSDDQKRILTVTKNNLSTRAPDLVYHITSNPSGLPTIHWLGTSYVSLPTLLKNTSELSAGRQVILNVLRDSDVSLGPKEIAERTGQKYEQVRLILRRMVAAQEILYLAYGHYTVRGHPSLTPPPPQEQATPETLDTLEPVSRLDPNVSDTLEPVNLPNSHVSETPETVETLDTVSNHDSNVIDTCDTPETVETLDTVSDLDSNVSDTFETPETLDTVDTVNDFDSHVSESFESLDFFDSHVSETPETLETLDTLEPAAFPDSNVSHTNATPETVDPMSNFDLHVSETPETLETLETLETVDPMSNLNLHVSETPETVETLDIVNDFDLHVSETPETPETVETLETVEAPDQTSPLDLDTITKTIRTIFYCSRDNHYVQWRVSDTRRIGCPLCDSWLVRDTIYNPTILALYEILNQHAPHENEHRHAWLERIAPFIP